MMSCLKCDAGTTSLNADHLCEQCANVREAICVNAKEDDPGCQPSGNNPCTCKPGEKHDCGACPKCARNTYVGLDMEADDDQKA